MRMTIVRAAGLAALLVGAGVAAGQGSTTTSTGTASSAKAKAPRSELEKAIDEALKHNLDLRVAQAKLALAEAEVARERMQVVQRVVATYYKIQEHTAFAMEAERKVASLLRQREMVKGSVSDDDLNRGKLALLQFKGAAEAARAELEQLTGKGASTKVDPDLPPGGRAAYREAYEAYLNRGRPGLVAPAPLEAGAAEKIRKVLDRKVTLKVTGVTARGLLDILRKQSGLHIQASTSSEPWAETITAELGEVPLGAAFQLLEDALPGHRVVVRAYGLLIVPQEKVPPGAVLLSEFWGAPGKTKEAPPTPAKSAPPEHVEGVVKAAKDGLIVVSVGSDAGLARGHTLDVYRLGPIPKYLGRLRVVEVQPKEAVCKPEGRLSAPIEVGDRVGSRIGGADRK